MELLKLATGSRERSRVGEVFNSRQSGPCSAGMVVDSTYQSWGPLTSVAHGAWNGESRLAL